MNSYFEQTFKQTVPLRAQIIRIFQAVEVMIVLLGIVGTAFILNKHSSESTWYEVGSKMGIASLFMFILTILPGMLRRFDQQKYLRQLLMLFRRHLGIMTYLLAASHSMLTSVAFRFSSADPSAVPIAQFELFGMIASNLMLLLFFTSNDRSVKWLGAWWKRLHKLVYVIGWLIATHIILQDVALKKLGLLSVIIVCVMVAEMVSFGVEARRKMIAKRAAELEG